MHYHQAYGLNIQSDFLLSELPTGGDGRDLYIQQGQVDLPAVANTNIPRQGIESRFGGTASKAYLEWPGIAKFLAQGGDRLIVEPTPAAIAQKTLSMYIVSEALGLILHQRGLLLIHASAIQVGDRAIIFAGIPGVGKSTTAAAFALANYPVLSDDMVAIKVTTDQQIEVVPAFPQVKIWPNSVQGLGYDSTKLDRLFPGSPKRVIRQASGFPTQNLPLSHLFFLENGDSLTLSPMSGADTIMYITLFFSCPTDVLQGPESICHFQQCNHIRKKAGVWRLQRPKEFGQLKAFVDNIHDFLADCERLERDLECSDSSAATVTDTVTDGALAPQTFQAMGRV